MPPNYDYQCICGNEEEVFHKIADMNKDFNCSKCKTKMDRKVSAPAVPSIVGRYEFNKNNDWSKNELAKELKQHDEFRKAEEKDTESMIKSGELIQSMKDI